jgi:hypothetical protein
MMAHEDHWLPGFNFNVEEWDGKRQTYETLVIRSMLILATPHSKLQPKPASRFMNPQRTRVVKRHGGGRISSEKDPEARGAELRNPATNSRRASSVFD